MTVDVRTGAHARVSSVGVDVARARVSRESARR